MTMEAAVLEAEQEVVVAMEVDPGVVGVEELLSLWGVGEQVNPLFDNFIQIYVLKEVEWSSAVQWWRQ